MVSCQSDFDCQKFRQEHQYCELVYNRCESCPLLCQNGFLSECRSKCQRYLEYKERDKVVTTLGPLVTAPLVITATTEEDNISSQSVFYVMYIALTVLIIVSVLWAFTMIFLKHKVKLKSQSNWSETIEDGNVMLPQNLNGMATQNDIIEERPANGLNHPLLVAEIGMAEEDRKRKSHLTNGTKDSQTGQIVLEAEPHGIQLNEHQNRIDYHYINGNHDSGLKRVNSSNLNLQKEQKILTDNCTSDTKDIDDHYKSSNLRPNVNKEYQNQRGNTEKGKTTTSQEQRLISPGQNDLSKGRSRSKVHSGSRAEQLIPEADPKEQNVKFTEMEESQNQKDQQSERPTATQYIPHKQEESKQARQAIHNSSDSYGGGKSGRVTTAADTSVDEGIGPSPESTPNSSGEAHFENYGNKPTKSETGLICQEQIPKKEVTKSKGPTYVNRKYIYDYLRKAPWVDGYFSAGRSIEVYVDLNTITKVWALQELTKQTDQLPDLFHVKHTNEQY